MLASTMTVQLMPFEFASAYDQLSPAERQFVDTFIADMLAAADRAGKTFRAHIEAMDAESLDSLSRHERDMLSRQLVSAAVHDRIRDIFKSEEINEARLTRELSYIAFANPLDYMRWDSERGMLVFDFSNMTPEKASAIAEVEYSVDTFGRMYMKKVKYHSKLQAMEMLGKRIDYFGEKAGHKVSGNQNSRAMRREISARLYENGL